MVIKTESRVFPPAGFYFFWFPDVSEGNIVDWALTRRVHLFVANPDSIIKDEEREQPVI